MSTLLDIKNLSISFQGENGYEKAVDGISFSIEKGKTIGVVGESGSGKSVTSLSIMKLLPEQNSKVECDKMLFRPTEDDAVDLSLLSRKQMQAYRGNEVAMIFQEPMTSLNPVITCGEQVQETILLHQKVSKKEAKEKVLRLFEEVHLPRPEDIFNSYPHQISGGQKQRVMIAMAISCNPSLLIADEPTTALDVTVQKTILDLLKKIQQEHNMGMVFISHDLGVVAEVADYVVVMYKGKVVEQGNVREIFLNPKHPYTRGLLACRPRMDVRLKHLPTVDDFVQENKGSAQGGFSFDNYFKDIIVSNEERKKKHDELYSNEPLLEVKNLHTYFPVNKGFFGKPQDVVKAVNDVSFNVYPGETLGLVGESGCGKTTLGRTIMRLLRPTSGEIIYRTHNITLLPESKLRSLRKEIQIIFQDPYSSLNPRMTIGNAIMEPLKVHGIYSNNKQRKIKVLEIMERVGLSPDHFHRYPHEFSGGQRQRVCIARALILRPKFVICDESVSALDVSVQAQVLNLLNELQREFGLTYIFISHDLSVVKFMSDRMIVMNKGIIEEKGDADEIYAKPKTAYTKSLIDAIPKGMETTV